MNPTIKLMQKLVPAILTGDVKELEEKLLILRGQSQWVHVDIMDGKFVPNVSFPISALAKFSDEFRFEVHLLVQNPENYLEDCKNANIPRIVFHWESIEDPGFVLKEAKKYSLEAVMGINPSTSPQAISSFHGNLDGLLLLSVDPGFQGREFIPSSLEKIRDAKVLYPAMTVGVDGGVNKETIQSVFEAKADYAILGSALWESSNPVQTLRELEAMVQ